MSLTYSTNTICKLRQPCRQRSRGSKTNN